MVRVISKAASKQIGQLLRALRIEQHWTQAHVAERLGVTSVTVRRWELGLREPSKKSLDNLAAIYDLDADRLMSPMLAPSERTKHWLGWYLEDGREAKNLSVEQAAIRIGISAEVLLSYETGQVDHDPNLLVKIVEQYELRLSRMLLRAMRSASHDHERYLDEVSAPPNASEIPIKGFVFAGIPQENYDVNYRDPIKLPAPIFPYADTFALLVSGDECKSEGIFDGDVIIILPENRPIFGKLYAVRIDGIPHLRRLIPEDGRLILKSPDGPTEDYQTATMELLGEVVGYYRDFIRTM